MYFVKPTAGAVYYLRTLLTVVKGATSFEDLRRVPGEDEPLPTFYDACLARGLLEDDGEWRMCLLEASQMQTGSRLRQLFATLLLFGEPSRPHHLWGEFWEDICGDLERQIRRMPAFQHQEEISQERVHDYGLFLLDRLLREAGRALSEWESMPHWELDWAVHVSNPLIAEQLNYDRNAEFRDFEERHRHLNPGQLTAFNTIVTAIALNQSRVFLLKGSAGTGKTFVYNTICARVRAEGFIVLCVSSSGISALLIRGGRTAHSMFKIPIDELQEGSICNIAKGTERADMMLQARAIIWDEIAPNIATPPFGGITTILGGDFLQTLPVVPGGSRQEIVDACIQRSYLWGNIEVLALQQNMRLEGAGAETRRFAEWLLELGHGRSTGPDGKVAFDASMRVYDQESLIASIYPDIDGPMVPPPDYFTHRMILAARNTDVSHLNQTILDKLPGDAQQYVSADTVLNEVGVDNQTRGPVAVEVLRSIVGSGLPPGELNLKAGCPVILLRNLNAALGLCNGTRMVVTRMGTRVIEGRILGGERDGELAFIPRIAIIPSETIGDITFTFKRRQFPLQLAFALTINKSQGQTVRHVGLDLRIPVFSHGQLYVALSRVTSPDNVKILLDIDDPVDIHRTENVLLAPPSVWNLFASSSNSNPASLHRYIMSAPTGNGNSEIRYPGPCLIRGAAVLGNARPGARPRTTVFVAQIYIGAPTAPSAVGLLTYYNHDNATFPQSAHYTVEASFYNFDAENLNLGFSPEDMTYYDFCGEIESVRLFLSHHDHHEL
ncbi:hypothetical protein NMY22_g18466 [Coprinellus aureogranulatus]|nr:hypothetical protein NMY22_g18466 [Coprinellus aureogranulatus]